MLTHERQSTDFAFVARRRAGAWAGLNGHHKTKGMTSSALTCSDAIRLVSSSTFYSHSEARHSSTYPLFGSDWFEGRLFRCKCFHETARRVRSRRTRSFGDGRRCEGLGSCRGSRS